MSPRFRWIMQALLVLWLLLVNLWYYRTLLLTYRAFLRTLLPGS